jgi:hypothetical protein
MRPLGPGSLPSAPAPGGSVIIFMRPSFVGGAIQSSVFELRPDGDKFVGIVSSKTKIAYATEPGPHLYMVTGENADFMRAQSEGRQDLLCLGHRQLDSTLFGNRSVATLGRHLPIARGLSLASDAGEEFS